MLAGSNHMLSLVNTGKCGFIVQMRMRAREKVRKKEREWVGVSFCEEECTHMCVCARMCSRVCVFIKTVSPKKYDSCFY